MPATKTPPARAAKPKPAPARTRRTAPSRGKQFQTAIDRTAELSADVLKDVESGQRAAIDAVRKFVDTVDEALPPHGEGPRSRQEVVDSALEMADKLVHTQYEFIRKVIDSAGKSMRRVGDTK